MYVCVYMCICTYIHICIDSQVAVDDALPSGVRQRHRRLAPGVKRISVNLPKRI